MAGQGTKKNGKKPTLTVVEGEAVSVRQGTPRSHALQEPVLRRHALHKLENAIAQLIVVHAPAGFGKTTLLRQYCDRREAEGARTAWVHFETRFADANPVLEALYDQLGFHGENVRRSVDDLSKRLAAFEKGAVIVFDDFDRALSPALKTFFSQLSPILPERVRILVASRSLPALQLPRLRLREKVKVLTEDDLRFSLAETQEFFKDRLGASPDTVSQLHAATDGWAAALQCYRLRGGAHGLMGIADQSTSGVTKDILDFLAADVFEGLDDSLQKQLLDICLPRTLSGELVEHLLHLDSGEGYQFLMELERQGLFLNRIEGRHGWFRFHGVFRTFLTSQMKARYAKGQMQDQHREIASFMTMNGSDDVALLHYIEAGDSETAIEILSQIAGRLVAEERLGLIVHCIERLPAEAVTGDKEVFFASVVAYAFRREFIKASALLKNRREALEHTAESDPSWGEYYASEMFLYAAQDRIADMGADCEKVGALLDESFGFQYAVSLNALAFWWIAQSRFDEARAILLRARSMHQETQSFFGQAYQESFSSLILSIKGNINDAQRALLMASREHDQQAVNSGFSGSVINAYLAASLYETNHFEDAKRVLNTSADMLEQQAIVDPLALMFQTQARLAFADEDQRGAEAIMERAIVLGHRYGLEALVSNAYLELARMATLSGNLEAARSFLENHDQSIMRSDLLFPASEGEGHTITRARLLVYENQGSAARKLLIPAMRDAGKLGRNYRLMRLKLIHALSLHQDNEESAARRALLEALAIAADGGAVRSILDEGPRLIHLLTETRRGLPKLIDETRRDAVVVAMDKLIGLAGAEWVSETEEQAFEVETADRNETLTPKELMILDLVNRGFSNKQLAERLSITNNTVKWHLRNIYEKLNAENRMHAVSVARHLGLLN